MRINPLFLKLEYIIELEEAIFEYNKKLNISQAQRPSFNEIKKQTYKNSKRYYYNCPNFYYKKRMSIRHK